jgi:hypothetical protein
MTKRKIYTDPTILPQGAIIEFVAQGSYVKVSAVDPITYEEVAIVGDPSAGNKRLQDIVCRKLERIVARKHGDAVARRRGYAPGTAKRTDPPSGWDL